MAEDREFLSCISKSPLPEIYAFLMKKQIPNIMKIRGSDNYTALHILASNNRLNAAEFLIRYSKDHYGPLFFKDIEAWVNETTYDEELTCTHMAILKGNLELVKLFLSYGAKLNTITRSGMTAMHLAAKSDQILMLAWLKNNGYDAECVDKMHFTPLHYSAMLSCELATAVLLSWRVKVNQKNNAGQIPLHLAVFSGSQRIIRGLLLRGADVNAKDNEGKTPLDMAIEKDKEDIISLIKAPGILSICGIKPPQRPIKFKSMLMSIYIFLLATGISSMFLLLKVDDLCFDILCALEILFFIIACCKNPGYLQKHHGHMLLELATTYECYQICPECVSRRPPRSRHCQTCNKCVEKFDHHCPWINNCIGASNLGVFYCFLIVTLSFIIYTAYLCVNYIYFAPSDYKSLIAGVFAAVAIGFFFPLLLLISVQTRNLLTNTTTNERYSRKVEANVIERSDSDEQVDRSSLCGNIVQMCCNTKKQEYKTKNSSQGEGVARYTVIANEYKLSQPLLNSNTD